MPDSCSVSSDEIGDSNADLSAVNEDAESESVLAAVYAAQPSLSTDLTRSIGDAITEYSTNIHLTADFTGLHSEIFRVEEFCSSPKFNNPTSESDDDCMNSVVDSQNGMMTECESDLNSCDLDKHLTTDSEGSSSICSENAQNSESDESEESDGSLTESETDDSSCSTEESQKPRLH